MTIVHSLQVEVRPYLLAVGGVLLAAAIRYELGDVLGGTIPVVMFTVPVVAAALYGGFLPGIFATCLGAAISNYLFIAPLHDFGMESAAGVVVTLTFLLIGLVLSWFGQRMKNLRASLANQANRLAAVNRELEQANKSKDVFLAMLAHELRNPLAGISTAAQLLRLAQSDPARVAWTGDVISRQVRHMTKLVDDLLDISRVTRGLVTIDRQTVDLREAVHAAVDQVRAGLAAKQQSLVLQLPDEAALVCGDRVRLTQVVGNLLSNANRYSASGSAVRIHLNVVEDTVELSIEDNGDGIDPALLPSIFDLFVQGERTPDRSQGGLGIGLALVKRIVELHDGRVSAHSAGPNQGSRFTLVLPRTEQKVFDVARGITPAEPAVPGAAMKILVVDDNEDAANATAMLLESRGHAPSVEYGAMRALDKVRDQQFDAVILDIGLPEIDGFELCRRMRSLPHLQRAVFIALSGYGQDSDRKKSKEAGLTHHLVKPVNVDELLHALRDAGRLAVPG